MRVPAVRAAHTLLTLSLLSGPAAYAAVQATVTDSCGITATGPSGSSTPTTVDPSGNVTLSQVGAPYTAMFGPCEVPIPATPKCTLSASQTRVVPGGSAQLFAKCTSSPTSFTWTGPSAGPAVANGSQNPVTLTFPTAGAYTYSVKGVNASGAGPASTQLTILVGTDTQTPVCMLTASPGAIIQGSRSTLQTTCIPTAASYNWTLELGVPAAPATGTGEVIFPTAGTFTYKVQGVNSVGAGSMNSATVTVTALLSPVLVDAFTSPSTVSVGNPSTLRINFQNPNGAALNSIAFNTTFQSGLVIAATPNASNTCGGTLSAVAGSGAFGLSAATLPASSACSVSVQVTSSTASTYTVATGPVTSNNAGAASGTSATLRTLATPLPAPSVSLSLVAANAGINGTPVLAITLANASAAPITGAAFAITYPAGLVNATPASASTTCGAPPATVTAANGGTGVSLSGGTIPGNGACSVTLKVTAAAAGNYVISVPAGAVTSGNAASNPSSVATTLAVSSCAPGPVAYETNMTTGATSPDVTLVNGQTAAFSFTLPAGGYISFWQQDHTYPYIYPQPRDAVYNISRCKGDLTAMPNNNGYCGPQESGRGTMIMAMTISGYPACVVEPGVTYYLNVRQLACDTGTCGFKMTP